MINQDPRVSKELAQLLKDNSYQFIASPKMFYIKPKGLSPIIISIVAVLLGAALLITFLFQKVLEIKLISLGFILISLPFFYQKWKALEAFSVFYEKKQYLLKKFLTEPIIILKENIGEILVHKRTLNADASPFHKSTKEYIYDFTLVPKSGGKYLLMQLRCREEPEEIIKELATLLEIR